jgi:hypothetical protein
VYTAVYERVQAVNQAVYTFGRTALEGHLRHCERFLENDESRESTTRYADKNAITQRWYQCRFGTGVALKCLFSHYHLTKFDSPERISHI